MAHTSGAGEGNILQLDQHIPDVDHSTAVPVPLAPGEASFHHGWTVHASAPNRSADRRIGLNVQYLAPHVRFAGDANVSATLVRGHDAHGHFTPSMRPEFDAEPEAVARWIRATEDMKGGFEAAPTAS